MTGASQNQFARSTTTGAWSLGPGLFMSSRSSRSMKAPVTRSARLGEHRAKSILSPLFDSDLER